MGVHVHVCEYVLNHVYLCCDMTVTVAVHGGEERIQRMKTNLSDTGLGG